MNRCGYSVGIIAFTAAVAASHIATAQGPASRYYLADADATRLQVVQSGTVVDDWSTVPRLSPLAVSGSVRAYNVGTLSPIHSFTGPGVEYTLEGLPTGATYPWQQGPTGQLLDGATDGFAWNFAAEWDGQNGIWRYDRGWKNPVRLFTSYRTIGITYDRSAGTLWISQDFGAIQQVDLAGVILSQFSPGTPGRWGALAWEPSTNTLWAKDNFSATMRQWSKDGTLLQEISVAGLSSNIIGGEFSMIPEPATFLCLIIGALGLITFAQRLMHRN
jgi:hypothetical protein